MLLLEKLPVQEKEKQQNELSEQEKLQGGEGAPVEQEEDLLEEEPPEELQEEELQEDRLREGELHEEEGAKPSSIFYFF